MKSVTETDDMAVETIVDTLRGDIISGRLAPGSVINSVDLAAHFGTSRTPVREALIVLNQDGLVTLSARRRARVAPVSVNAIRDLYGVRTALHAYIAQAIVAHAPLADLQQMRTQAGLLIDETGTRPSTDLIPGIEDYLAFEAGLCGNDLVIQMLESLKWRINWFRRLGTMNPDQLRTLARDRLRVADAYLERDAALAIALNSAMLRKAAQYCEQNFLQRFEGSASPRQAASL